MCVPGKNWQKRHRRFVLSPKTAGIETKYPNKLLAFDLMSKILVVEDDEFLAETIADCLTFTGYAADRIGTGTEASAMMRANHYDLVLLDSMLPDMNGLDILKAYRAEKGSSKILFLTGAKKNEEAAMELGADFFLSKPFEIDELLSVVARLTGSAPANAST